MLCYMVKLSTGGCILCYMVKLSTGGCIPLPSPSSSSPDSPVPVPGGLLVRHCKCSGSTRTPPAPAHHTTVT